MKTLFIPLAILSIFLLADCTPDDHHEPIDPHPPVDSFVTVLNSVKYWSGTDDTTHLPYIDTLIYNASVKLAYVYRVFADETGEKYTFTYNQDGSLAAMSDSNYFHGPFGDYFFVYNSQKNIDTIKVRPGPNAGGYAKNISFVYDGEQHIQSSRTMLANILTPTVLDTARYYRSMGRLDSIQSLIYYTAPLVNRQSHYRFPAIAPADTVKIDRSYLFLLAERTWAGISHYFNPFYWQFMNPDQLMIRNAPYTELIYSLGLVVNGGVRCVSSFDTAHRVQLLEIGVDQQTSAIIQFNYKKINKYTLH